MKAGVVGLLLIIGAVQVQAEKHIIPDFGEIEIISDPHDPLHFANEWQVNEFVGTEGFGMRRMIPIVPGIHGSVDRTWATIWNDDNERTEVTDVELVGLLIDHQPRVYLTDRGISPATLHTHDSVKSEGRNKQSGPSYKERGVGKYDIDIEQLEDGDWRYFRKLDVFEAIALRELSAGAQVVRWNNGDGRTRAVGALRAMQSCIECHTKAKEGDLLGAFTYHLKREKHTPEAALEIRGYRERLSKLLNEGTEPSAFWAVLGEPEPVKSHSEFESFFGYLYSDRYQLRGRLMGYGIVSKEMEGHVRQLRQKARVRVSGPSDGKSAFQKLFRKDASVETGVSETKPRLSYRGAYPRPVRAGE